MNRITFCCAWAGAVAVTITACGGGNTHHHYPQPIATTSPAPESSPEVFQPRPHPPHEHPSPPPPPDLNALPAMVNQLDRCYGAPDRFLRRQPGSVRGRGVSGGGVGTARPTVAPKSASAPPPPAAEAEPADSVRKRPASESKRLPRKGEASREESAEPPPPALVDVDSDDSVVANGEYDNANDEYHDWGQAIYLSNDDTMSLSSAQRVIHAIDNFLPLPPEHIRPHELLNYFSFDVATVESSNDFSVLPGVVPKPNEPGIYSLGLAVRGWPVDAQSRRNAQLSIVVDRSGSMSAEGRMDYLKRGLVQMTDQLKRGDIVHLTLFDHDVCVPLKNFVVGRDDMNVLKAAIRRMRPQGSTDLHAGLRTGYDLADRAYQPTYTNRVVMVTDAMTNTGVTDEKMISMVGKYYDSRRIRLSGVGVGHEFNDSLLDQLTERGRGAYVFLGSAAEVDAVFGTRFVSLIETTATDVHFRLHLPQSLRMNVFYGEESSVHKEDVQSIHYFANTSQLFLQDVMARGGELRLEDQVMLTIEYEHPETGQEQVEEYAFTLGEMQGGERNVKKGLVLMRFIDGLAWMARRQYQGPGGYGRGREGTWSDPEAYGECRTGREQLVELSQGIDDDPEVRRVLGLWDRYCARFEKARNPVRRKPGQRDAWPSAAE